MRAVAATIRTTRLTTTDAEGRYEFANLPAARYTISVSKAGYVGLEFGQRRPFEGGRPLDLADAQVVEQIDFALPRGGVIAGRITDDQGDPIIGACGAGDAVPVSGRPAGGGWEASRNPGYQV